MKIAEWKTKQSQPRITEDNAPDFAELADEGSGTEGEGDCVSDTPVRLQTRGCIARSHVVELRRGDAS
jgi:hypothetical protein